MKSERSEPPVSTLVLHVLYSSLYLRVDSLLFDREGEWSEVKWSEWVSESKMVLRILSNLGCPDDSAQKKIIYFAKKYHEFCLENWVIH